MDPRLKKGADEARRRRHEALAIGDHETAKKMDALEREFLGLEPGGDAPCVGADGRTV